MIKIRWYPRIPEHSKHTYFMKYIITITAILFTHSLLHAADWPMWGRTIERNMVANETGIPASFKPGEESANSEEIDMKTTENIKWVAKLGSQTYGNVAVAQGKVFVGTNNETPRLPDTIGDRGILMVFDEKTGNFLYQVVVPKLGAKKVSDWEFVGICSSPAIEGNRGYIVTNRCEIICFDIEGMANGNDGPFKDEGLYMAGEGKPPVKVNNTHADIIWVFNMRVELGSFPHNVSSSSPFIKGDYVYAATSNGVDWSHKNIPGPNAPAFVAINKLTGELAAEEASGISTRVLHASWSSPTFGNAAGRDMIIFGAGDGWLYSLDPKPVTDEDGFNLFKEFWKYDANPPHYRMKDGKPIKYATQLGPKSIVASSFFSLVACSIARSPSSLPRYSLPSVTSVDDQMRPKVSCSQ